jgi:hypothetical protein
MGVVSMYYSDSLSRSKKCGKSVTCQSSIAGRLEGCRAELSDADAGGGQGGI